MNASMEQLSALLDRERIRDCLARLARGEDRRDALAISACFLPDAKTDYGIFAGAFAEYLAWVVPGSPAVLNTQHFLGQSVIETDAIEAGGQAARVETPVISYHRIAMGSEERDVCIAGRYLDVFARADGAWRIAARTMLYDWVQDFGRSADWAQGVMGTPFSAPHFTGRAHGDHSETFFRAITARPA